jgi:hypothetical protein
MLRAHLGDVVDELLTGFGHWLGGLDGGECQSGLRFARSCPR